MATFSYCIKKPVSLTYKIINKKNCFSKEKPSRKIVSIVAICFSIEDGFE